MIAVNINIISGWYFNNRYALPIDNTAIVTAVWQMHWKYAIDPSSQQYHNSYSKHSYYSTTHLVIVVITFVVVGVLLLLLYYDDQPLPI